jgi:GNAT superfamily N-acetyltransferase
LRNHAVNTPFSMHWALRPLAADELSLLYDITHTAMGPYVERAYGVWDEAVQRRNCAQSAAAIALQVIVADGVAAGILGVQELADLHYLRTIYLYPRFQKSGLGARVLAYVIARADVRGLPVKLRVFHINPAQRLYARLGFATTEIVDDIRRVMMRPPTLPSTNRLNPRQHHQPDLQQHD